MKQGREQSVSMQEGEVQQGPCRPWEVDPQGVGHLGHQGEEERRLQRFLPRSSQSDQNQKRPGCRWEGGWGRAGVHQQV